MVTRGSGRSSSDRDRVGTRDLGSGSSNGLAATSSGSSCGGSLYWVDCVLEQLNSPEGACDSAGLPGATPEDERKIPPVSLLDGRYQGESKP